MTQDHVPTDERSRIAALLRRYPDVRADERETILHFLTRGPIAERGMLRGEASLVPAIAAVERDHPARFRASPLSGLVVALLIIVPLLLMWWVSVHWLAK